MVNIECCGNQDRATTTSERYPERPPQKTRNCYLKDKFLVTCKVVENLYSL